MRTRFGPCLVLVAATLFGGWPVLPACACESVSKQTEPVCCCTKAVPASGSKCACCQMHAPRPVSTGDARCACTSAPADQSPPTTPTTPTPTAGDDPAGLSDCGLDFALPLAARPALISPGRPPTALIDLVISLSRLTC